MCKFAFLASFLALVFVIYMPNSAYAGTKVSDFLKWERKSQIFFLQTSLDMIGTIVPHVNKKLVPCLNDWYFKDANLQEKRQNEILEVMKKYQEFKPAAVILGYVESVCGPVDRN